MPSSNSLIDNLFSDSSNDTRRRNPRANRSRGGGGFENDDDDDNTRDLMNSSELLQSLNQTATVADLILNDTNQSKRNAISVLSKQSAVAKTVLTAVDNKESSLRLDTIGTINFLQLLSDVYDNKFVITSP